MRARVARDLPQLVVVGIVCGEGVIEVTQSGGRVGADLFGRHGAQRMHSSSGIRAVEAAPVVG